MTVSVALLETVFASHVDTICMSYDVMTLMITQCIRITALIMIISLLLLLLLLLLVWETM
jgi:hypothetical protein